MKLPTQETPEYKLVLPISKQEISYRPFLVKEQKNLLLAREGKDAEEIFTAISNLLKSVTDEKTDGHDLPLADLEYLFLQIRCKSIGETSKLLFPCVNEECTHSHELTVDLSEIEVNQDNLPENKIQISDELMIELKYPTSKLVAKVADMTDDEAVKPILRDCMVRIFDKEEIYELKEFPDREIDNFIDNMTIEQFEKVMIFFNAIPVLKKEYEWECSKCKTHNNFTAQGLQNFF